MHLLSDSAYKIISIRGGVVLLAHLTIHNFRNIMTATFDCCAGLHMISGDNGSGKTSLLEAIYYLGWGRSFRTASPQHLIRQTEQQFSIVAHLTDPTIVIGVERDQDKTQWRVAERNITAITELMFLFPVRLLDAHSHALLEAGPLMRRQYLDWGIFYQSTNFLSCWRQFTHALKQRNILLRGNPAAKELAAWTAIFIQHGMMLDQIRREYVMRLVPILLHTIAELFGDLPIKIDYQPGWRTDTGLAETLERYHAIEYRYGYTLYGPQRADLVMSLLHGSVKQLLSRGQQKLLVYAMIIAQGILLLHTTQQHVIYLIDDLPAELDRQQQYKVINLLAKQQAQIFMATTEWHMLDDYQRILQSKPVKMFHVKHGNIQLQGC